MKPTHALAARLLSRLYRPTTGCLLGWKSSVLASVLVHMPLGFSLLLPASPHQRHVTFFTQSGR